MITKDKANFLTKKFIKTVIENNDELIDKTINDIESLINLEIDQGRFGVAYDFDINLNHIIFDHIIKLLRENGYKITFSPFGNGYKIIISWE